MPPPPAIFFNGCDVPAILFLMDLSQKLITSSEIPREPAYQIHPKSYSDHQKYLENTHQEVIFSKLPLWAILFSTDPSPKLIR